MQLASLTVSVYHPVGPSDLLLRCTLLLQSGTSLSEISSISALGKWFHNLQNYNLAGV